MYSYIKGKITFIKATHITIETAGIGYLIKVPNPYSFSLNEDTIIYLHQHIKEDAIELFGFSNETERDTFEKLINVKGLGPKGALAILAAASPQEIKDAVENASAKFFVKFPGIGTKLSQQIILDLKGKIDFNDETSSKDDRLDQVASALKALGYSNIEIKNTIKNLTLEKETTLNEAIKMALKLLRS